MPTSLLLLDPDIQGTVDRIDRRIAKLSQMKAMLIEEFCGSPSVELVDVPLTRKQQLEAFLLKNGPSLRRDIITRTGIPEGTVASLLGTDDFSRSDDGRWSVRRKIEEPTSSA